MQLMKIVVTNQSEMTNRRLDLEMNRPPPICTSFFAHSSLVLIDWLRYVCEWHAINDAAIVCINEFFSPKLRKKNGTKQLLRKRDIRTVAPMCVTADLSAALWRAKRQFPGYISAMRRDASAAAAVARGSLARQRQASVCFTVKEMWRFFLQRALMGKGKKELSRSPISRRDRRRVKLLAKGL